jgi:hypothetical protein
MRKIPRIPEAAAADQDPGKADPPVAQDGVRPHSEAPATRPLRRKSVPVAEAAPPPAPPPEEPEPVWEDNPEGGFEATEDAWRAFVDSIKGRVGGVLAQVSLEGGADGKLLLGASGIPADELQPLLDGALGERISRAFGGLVPTIVSPSGGSESVSKKRKREHLKAVEDSRERLRGHAAVAEVKSVFPGAELHAVHSQLEDPS